MVISTAILGYSCPVHHIGTQQRFSSLIPKILLKYSAALATQVYKSNLLVIKLAGDLLGSNLGAMIPILN